MFTLPFSLVADVSVNIPQSQRRELTILQSCLSLKLAGSGLCNAAEPLSEQTHHQVETASTCQLLFSAEIKSVSALLQLVWSKPALQGPAPQRQVTMLKCYSQAICFYKHHPIFWNILVVYEVSKPTVCIYIYILCIFPTTHKVLWMHRSESVCLLRQVHLSCRNKFVWR